MHDSLSYGSKAGTKCMLFTGACSVTQLHSYMTYIPTVTVLVAQQVSLSKQLCQALHSAHGQLLVTAARLRWLCIQSSPRLIPTATHERC